MATTRFFILKEFYDGIIKKLYELSEFKASQKIILPDLDKIKIYNEIQIEDHWKIFSLTIEKYIDEKLYPQGKLDENFLKVLHRFGYLFAYKIGDRSSDVRVDDLFPKVKSNAKFVTYYCKNVIQQDAYLYYLGIRPKKNSTIGFTYQAVKIFAYLFADMELDDKQPSGDQSAKFEDLIRHIFITEPTSIFVEEKIFKDDAPSRAISIKKNLAGTYIGSHLDNDYSGPDVKNQFDEKDGSIRTIKLELKNKSELNSSNQLDAKLYIEYKGDENTLSGMCYVEVGLDLIRLEITDSKQQNQARRNSRVNLYFNIEKNHELQSEKISLKGVYAGKSEEMKNIQCGCIIFHKVNKDEFDSYTPSFYYKENQFETKDSFFDSYNPEIDLMECFDNHVDSIGKCIHRAFRANYTAPRKKYDGPAGTFLLVSIANSGNGLELVSYPIKINSRGYVILKNHDQDDNTGIALYVKNHILLLDFNNKRNKLFNGFYMFNLANRSTMTGNKPNFKLAFGVSMRVNGNGLCQTKKESIVTDNFNFEESKMIYPIKPNDENFNNLIKKFDKPEYQKLVKNLYGDIRNLIIADPIIVPIQEIVKEDLCNTFLTSSLFFYASSQKENTSLEARNLAIEQIISAAKYGLADTVEFRRKLIDAVNNCNFSSPINLTEYLKFIKTYADKNDILKDILILFAEIVK